MRNFELLAKGLSVSHVMRDLYLQPELFDEMTLRQDFEGSPHKDTKCVILRWCKSLDLNSAFTEIPAFNFPAMGKLPSVHELIQYTLHRVSASELGRVLIVSLCPSGRILPHADEGTYADYYERFHIALNSEEGSHFKCGDETVHMKTGELWYFNHKAEHEVSNLSSEPRVHLIIDALAPKFHRERVKVPHAV